MPLNVWCEQGKGFLLMHRLCPKPEAPSRQMALPGTEAAAQKERADRYYIDPTQLGIEPGTDYATYPLSVLDGIDASTDEPAPEIDPPGPYARFEEMYPAATDYPSLYEALKSALSDEQWRSLRRFDQWQPASDTFRSVANWARIEKAHADAGAREPIAGLTLPRREPMPETLVDLLGVKAKQKKGARPLVNPKRKGKTATP